jgi:hypothetical protein
MPNLAVRGTEESAKLMLSKIIGSYGALLRSRFGIYKKQEHHLKETQEHHCGAKVHPASSSPVEEGPLIKDLTYFKHCFSHAFSFTPLSLLRIIS